MGFGFGLGLRVRVRVRVWIGVRVMVRVRVRVQVRAKPNLVAQLAARALHQPRPLVRYLAHLAQPVAHPLLRSLQLSRQVVHSLDHEYDGVAVTAQLLR